MNYFVHRMLGHFLMDEIDEDGAPGAGAEVEQEEEIEQESEQEQEEEDDEPPLEGEITVSLGDEPEQESEEEKEAKAAPKWVKELRKNTKEQARRIKELEQQLQQKEQPAPEIQLGKKPTLEDFDYDTDKFEAEYESWLSRKRQIEDQQAAAKRQQEEAQAAWNSKIELYQQQRSELKVRDYDDAEQNIRESLDDTQRNILVAGLDNPALMVYALGKNSEQLKRLAAIKDPVRFAVEIGKLETQVKTKARSEKPAPEKRVSPGSGSLSAATDRTLEQLRAEAEKTGDYTKVHQYKRQQKMKQA